jgi:energy-coupling factor transporter ATP-binding protein EcfA2
MRARIRNLLGVEAADLPLARIALIGGRNGAGKSSILEGLACVVRGEHGARDVKTKKDAPALVRSGAPSASALIEWEDGSARVLWPEGEAKTEGTPRALGTPLGIGSVRWMSLSDKRRAEEMAERLRLQPTRDHLASWLADHAAEQEKAGKPIDPVKPETIDAVWVLIERQGWDGAHAKAAEQVTKLRGAWEDRTKERFGSAKAATWRPPILDESEVYTVEAAEAELAKFRKAVEDLLVAGAVSAEDVERARKASEDLGPAQARETAARAKMAELDAAIEAERAAIAKMPWPEEVVHTYPCPHCERPLWLHRENDTEPYKITKPPKEIPAAEIKKRRLDRQAREQSAAKMERELRDVTDEAQKALAAVKAAQEATARLAELEARPKVTDEAMADARADATRAEVTLMAVKDWQEAQRIFAEWRRSQPVLGALSPDGVRAARVAEAIAAFNLRLAHLSGIAGFGEVALNPDTTPVLAGRAYHLLSESERWRVDLVLTLALAELEKAALVLVDRLDVLHPQARPGVFQLLAHAGIPAVVCCTAKDAGALPPLHKVKVPGTDEVFGATYWIENGRLAPVE